MNTSIKISPSGLGLFTKCRRAYWYTYNRELEKNVPKAAHFEKGTYAHSIGHEYYAALEAGLQPGNPIMLKRLQNRTMADLKEAMSLGSPSKTQMIRDVSAVFLEYLNNYSSDSDRNIKVEGIERYLTHDFEIDGVKFTLHGYADLLYRTKGGTLVVRDLKTGENSRAWSEYKVKINAQLIIYLYLASKLYPEQQTFRGEILFMLTKFFKNPTPLDTRFKLLTVSYTRDELETVFKELSSILVEAATLTEEKAVMAMDKDACAGCQFSDLCDAKLRGKPVEPLIKNLYRKRENSNGTKPVKTDGENAGQQAPEGFTLRINF
jgi:CRISPR/Cas system-associated exonuclease Cas4 (RecB family)